MEDNTQKSLQEADSTEREPIKPHSYSRLMQAFLGLLVISAVYSLYSGMDALRYYKILQEGRRAYSNKDYDTALTCFARVKEKFATSRILKLTTAEVLFALNTDDSNDKALRLLSDMYIKNAEWEQLTLVMSKEVLQKIYPEEASA